MIYVTGDTHGGLDGKKLDIFAKEHPYLTKKDFIIILGDFGYIFYPNANNEKEKYQLKHLNTLPYSVLFIDGNHCISYDTDILTDKGFKNIVDVYYGNDKIANFDIKTKHIQFDYPIKKHKVFQEKAIEIDGKNTNQCISYNHDVIIHNKKVKASTLLDKNIKEEDFILHGNIEQDIQISDDMIRLLTNVVMDATIIDFHKKNINSNKCTIQFHLSKTRKIEHLENLLKRLSIPYSKRICKKSKLNILQPYYIRIYSDSARMIKCLLNDAKQLPDFFRFLNIHQTKVLFDEILFTDGSYEDNKKGNNGCIWNTISKHDVDIVQEVFIKNGFYCYYNVRHQISGFQNGKAQYIVNLYLDKKINSYVHVASKMYCNDMYCFTMPLGTLITRRKGKIAFTGNCNFSRLNAYPIEMWNGGKIHKISDSIFHLMRGQVFEIDGIKIFTMGGAESYDKLYRREGFDWWREEIPSYQEISEMIQNADDIKKVDYILTHTCTSDIVPKLVDGVAIDPTNQILDVLNEKINYKHWYFGHWHIDKNIDKKHTCLYNKIIPIGETFM